MPDPAGPKTRLPTDLLTGDARIDDHLAQLDRALVGTARVRRPVVQELCDFLLDARQSALQEGRDADAAVTEAIAAAGSIDDIARDQRAAKRREFLWAALLTGLGYGLLMMLYGWLDDKPISALRMLGEFVVLGVLFGSFMGALTAYCWSPSVVAADTPPPDGAFHVHLSPYSRRWTYLVLAMFAVLVVACVASLTGRGPGAPAAWSVVVLVLLTNSVVSFLRTLRFDATVSADRAILEGLSGRHDISRAQVMRLKKVGMPRRLLHMPIMGDIHDLIWRDAAGEAHRIMLPLTPEVVHGDRLLSWLESAAEDNARQG